MDLSWKYYFGIIFQFSDAEKMSLIKKKCCHFCDFIPQLQLQIGVTPYVRKMHMFFTILNISKIRLDFVYIISNKLVCSAGIRKNGFKATSKTAKLFDIINGKRPLITFDVFWPFLSTHLPCPKCPILGAFVDPPPYLP